MTCAEAGLAMLDAEPADLVPSGDGPLARHLEACDACRADAAAILAHAAELRADLAVRVAAHTDDTTAVRAARRAVEADRAETGEVAAVNGRARSARARSFMRTVAPLLAAAAIGALLLGGEEVRSWLTGPATVTFHIPAPEVPDAPVVNAGAARGVAVMRTTDPRITVVWTF